MNARLIKTGTVCLALSAIALATLQSDQQYQTNSNAKQLALGMLMYALDYDDVMPWAQDTQTAKNITLPYIKNREVWNSLNPNGGTLAFNTNIGGVALTQIDEPAGMPMYYDSKAWPDGSRVIAFLDGHANIEPKSRLAAIDKMGKKKFKRIAKKPLPKNYKL